MKAADRLELTPWQAFSHYGAALFIWIVFAMFLFTLIKKYNSAVNIDTIDIAYLFSWLLVAVLLSIAQYRRLNFVAFNVDYTHEQFNEALNRTKKDLEWRIKKNNKSIMIAYRPGYWSSSLGEMITIKKQEGRLLLNSICSPDRPISATSYGWDSKNLVTFMYHLGDAINNEPYEAAKEVVINEWSAKRIVTRIFLYPLALFLILLALYFLFTPASYGRGLFAALSAAALAVTYLYMDIKMIMGKGE